VTSEDKSKGKSENKTSSFPAPDAQWHTLSAFRRSRLLLVTCYWFAKTAPFYQNGASQEGAFWVLIAIVKAPPAKGRRRRHSAAFIFRGLSER